MKDEVARLFGRCAPKGFRQATYRHVLKMLDGPSTVHGPVSFIPLRKFVEMKLRGRQRTDSLSRYGFRPKDRE